MTLIFESTVAPEYSVIWMHGLGASNRDMYGIAQALQLEEHAIRHVCLQAPERPVTINQNMFMPAWYDIVGNSLTDREDRHGITDSEQLIVNAIEEQQSQGISSKNIFLAGFSQGGAMALHTGFKYPAYLGGVMALSCYLPLASDFSPTQRKTLPVFFAYGSMDPIVWPIWSEKSYETLQACGYKRIAVHQYPMLHEVCQQELQDLRAWLLNRIE
jgi:phospholipase/carboxylesterase